MEDLKIDEGIRKIVYILNKYNFKTNSSCEGHISRDEFHTPYPWVNLLNNSRNERQEMDKAYRTYIKSSLNEDRIKYSIKKLIYQKKLANNNKPLYELIAKFNKTAPLYELTIVDNNLQTNYTQLQFTLGEDEAYEKCLLMRKSLDDFADFIESQSR
jgi:hypothetical protein